MVNTLKSYRFFLKYITILLILFDIARVALIVKYNINIDIWFWIYSLRMDIIAIFVFLLIPIILFSLNLILLTRVILTIQIVVFTYLEIANYLFFEEFHNRLNYLFVSYLKYPQEIFDMLWESYKLQIIVVVPLLIFIAIKFFKYSAQLSKSSILHKILLFPFVFVILFLGIRSSVSDSTPNQSFYSYSNSAMTNEIVNNTVFSLLYSVYLKSKETMPNYGKLQNKNYKLNLLHHQSTTFKKKKNIVLVLMESFGSSYVGSLGGTPTTPHFDTMSKDGLFLSNMYSSSNRSNRGFEAVTSSLFPTYADSYLKLPKSINNFYTIAKTMQKNGYKTIFLYGGDSKFDNMKGFALNNGFDKVIDKFDFDKSIKRYTWGVCDEELYKKANQILNNTKQPLFLMMFTLSSHKPFDYPDGKIKYYTKAPVKSFANSIKYADFALNQFYNSLKNKHFFKDGVLAMVADHNAHMFGDQKIPVKEFKIPALIIAKDLKPQNIKGVTHQIDIAPTLLDIAGIDATIPTMGIDLTKNKHSRALIIHRNNFAYLENNKFVLYQINKPPIVYNFDYKQLPKDNKLIQKGLMYIYQSYDIYQHQTHKDTDEKH